MVSILHYYSKYGTLLFNLSGLWIHNQLIMSQRPCMFGSIKETQWKMAESMLCTFKKESVTILQE